jgi:hypothetical protein
MTELAVFSDNNVKSISLLKVVSMSGTNNQTVKIMHSLFAAIIQGVCTLADGGAPHP